MDPQMWTELARQGVASVIALGAFVWIIRSQQKMLEQILKGQSRQTSLMYRLLRELGVIVTEEIQ